MTDPQSVPLPASERLVPMMPSGMGHVDAAAFSKIPFLRWGRALAAWMDHLDSEATCRAYAATLRMLFMPPGMVGFVGGGDVRPALRLARCAGAPCQSPSWLT
jgi:hypothetical protein